MELARHLVETQLKQIDQKNANEIKRSKKLLS